MTNVEYIFEFANKHNFPKTECEVVFKTDDDGSGRDIYTTDYDIIAVKFDKHLVENEIKIEDIQFDIDTNLHEDVFWAWQKDNPKISFKGWIAMGRYVPNIIQNTEFLDELDMTMKEIEMRLGQYFETFESGDDDDYEDSDFYEEEYYEDSDFYEEDGEE